MAGPPDHKKKEKNVTDPNHDEAEPTRIWTPDPNSRGVPDDPFGEYFGQAIPDTDGPDI